MKTETSTEMELLPLLCLCLLTRSGITSAQLNGPKNIKVEGGTDVVLPCSLSTKENVELKLFDWRKDAQKDDGLKEVFMYDSGNHYNNGRDGQSEEFKGRVSHFQDELKYGNASIIIRNTKVTDSGEYSCYFPRLRPPQIFYIELVVEPKVITVKEDSDVVLPCSLSTKENITSKQFDWKKVAQKDDCQKDLFYYNGGSNDNKNCFPGQVSHFPDELKHGNTSIIIRNTKVIDRGVYTCDFPNLQPPQKFHIKLVVVGAALKPSLTILDATADSALLQCEVHGNPKPKVELQDSDGNNLNAKVTQDSEREGSFYITLQTTVTKTGTYRCVVTQEEIKHQIYAETSVHISGPKVITVEEGSDVILPFSLSTKKDIPSTEFILKKVSLKTDDGQKVFLYDKCHFYSFECPVVYGLGRNMMFCFLVKGVSTVRRSRVGIRSELDTVLAVIAEVVHEDISEDNALTSTV
ncbi:CD276 antigen-like [Sander lucioperca]|uniref:CD276 antigen-like n=1 Tax=Sander lucioperca TaxID=283035 RepID=UPI0016538DB2|nr:CD276 antigen-like [Sander lucioperca]